MLRILDSVNDPGKGRDSEDRVGSVPDQGVAWVLDGATDVCATRLIPDAPSDAYWFADTAQALLQGFGGGPSETAIAALIDGLRDTLEDRTGRPVEEVPPGDMPSAALTRLTVDADGGMLTFCGFPDCTTLILPPSGVGFAVQKPPAPRDEQQQARRLLSSGADIAAALRANRSMMNRPGGYPVLSVHSAAMDGLDRRTVRAGPGTRILLCTDGLYRLVEMYGLLDDDGLIRAACETGLGALIDRLRGFEADAADDIRFGRFKTSDDAAGLLLELV